MFAEKGDKGALASSSIAALDATVFPHKSPIRRITPSFQPFEQNAHIRALSRITIRVALQANARTLDVEKRGLGGTHALSPRPCSRLVQRSAALLPSRAARAPVLVLLPLPRCTGNEPKWWCFSGGDTCRTRPPPSGSDGSLTPKMPDPAPPPRQRRHPPRIPRLPLSAGGGGVGGASDGKDGGGRRILHFAVLFSAIFPSPLNHRRPQRQLPCSEALA